MLILTRKKDEKIRIGREITVMVVDIVGDRVRLGINAPTDISIMREEVAQKLERDGQNTKEQRTTNGLERPAS